MWPFNKTTISGFVLITSYNNLLLIFSALGTGGMIYYATVVAIYTMDAPECRSDIELANAIVAMVTIGIQIMFLFKYSKVGNLPKL